MTVVPLLTSLAALIFVYFFMPALWLSFMVDESDAHHLSTTGVASRNPFRETGPPANMAKLILLRHKVVAFAYVRAALTRLCIASQIQTTNKRRRRTAFAQLLWLVINKQTVYLCIYTPVHRRTPGALYTSGNI
ncbi:hypothetical protein FISHEDRAFT_60756 [Fistulina hepatica ATCC 64428]|uniref:Uncharacterized protein n=1 Tax=Fistulina hepatica ATCC 64428 TaxID=1128425 RepID=A0A0D7A5C1_9AGAR|nr:hypothetical protein FISHEDRAFT_60756 [Fistulina hepatica ATCC 64428]